MMKAVKEIPRLKDYQDFTNPENRYGLPMVIAYKGDSVESSFHIPGHMAGWRSSTVVGAHPGAVDTALATITGHGALALTKTIAMLKSMSTEYYDLVPVDTEVHGAARMVRKRGLNEKEVVMQGEIKNAAGQLLASCSATYALFATEELAKSVLCAQPYIKQMTEALQTL